MEHLVSVIMPIYKAEKYLKKSVGSLINQTYKNLEIILVNDCSPDNSLQVCEHLAAKDSRIKIVDKPRNEGEDLARFSGIEVATGDWLTFLDADDWFTDNAIELLLTTALDNACDIVYGTMLRKFGKIWDKKMQLPASVLNHRICGEEKEELFISWFGMNLLPVNMAGNLFNARLFNPTPIKSGLKLGADLAMSLQLYQRASCVFAIDTPIYVYLWRGVTAGHQHSMLESAKRLYEIRRPIAEANRNSEKLTKFLNIELVNYVRSYIGSLIEWRSDKMEQNLAILRQEQEHPVYKYISTQNSTDPFRQAIIDRRFDDAYLMAETVSKLPKQKVKAFIQRSAKKLLTTLS